jgi:hypothetical protein
MSSPFTESNCGYGYNYQLATNVLANDNNQSFIWNCYNSYLSSLPIEPCLTFNYLTFCIGGHNQQHACALGKCTVIDWSNAHAGSCSTPLTNFTSVQSTSGLAPTCCDSSLCTDPVPASYNCTTGTDLWLCVVEGGISAECVKPRDSSICSSNFTSTGQVLSSTAGASASGLSSSSTGGGGISQSSMILIIVFSTVMGVSLLSMSARYLHRRRQQRLPTGSQVEEETRAERQPWGHSGTLTNRTTSGDVVVNRSNLMDIGRNHNTYHVHGEHANICR